MKKNDRAIGYLCCTAVLVVLFMLGFGCGTSQVPIPAEAKPTCTVSDTEFASWFELGAVTPNGVVTPANSVNFSDIPNCDFYIWSERMFLWLTSPAPARYGGGGKFIFNSPSFYDVSSPGVPGESKFIPHATNGLASLNLRASQVGPLTLPILFNRQGELQSIEPPVFSPEGKQLVLDAAGDTVAIDSAAISVGGLPMFFNAKRERIKKPRPIIAPDHRDARIVQKFMIGSVPFFLNGDGDLVDVEQGQAGGNDVLMAQNLSLVYFRATVNDVFAYYITALRNGDLLPPGGDFNSSKFPTTQSELDGIINYASSHGKTLVDPEALTIELKTSWIETTLLADTSRFIILDATIPTYDQSDPRKWIANGQKQTKLALVGMHVVGSTKGHPEMIWATFEHVSATPNAEYTFTKSDNTTTTVVQTTAGNWLFCQNEAADPFNVPHMFYNSTDNSIEANPGFDITPSNTIRWKAWGKAAPGATTSNTQVISINNSILGKLMDGDKRKNYMLTGATWTIGGAPPAGSNEVGTNRLANTTMETYQQGASNSDAGTNCFTCHSTNTVRVSHVARAVDPLF